MQLRPYQEAALKGVAESFNEGARRVLAVLATGCGKTVIFASLIDEMLRKHPGQRCMVLAHRAELIWQARAKVQAVTGRSVGVEMGEHHAEGYFGRSDDVVVSTIQTQNSGEVGRMTLFDPDEFALIVVDEAHHATSASYQKVINYYLQNPACKLIGVTATPDRADEVSMGKAFDAVAYDYDVGDAIKDGWLTPITQQLVTITGLDFSHIKTTAGDLNGGELAEELEKEKNLYGVADATIKLSGDKRTLVFAQSVKQAERLTEIINRYKPDSAAFISGKTPKEERQHRLDLYHSGAVQYLVNCAVLTEGFDEPDTAVVVMAKPTKSRALYAQMLGRGTRPASSVAGILGNAVDAEGRKALIATSGKPSVLVLDFAGNAGRHKLVTSIDILGECGSNRVDDEVVAEAKKIVEKAGTDGLAMPTEEALAKAAKELEERKLREMARRANLKARATFSAVTVDPFGTLSIKHPVARGWDRARRPSDRQIEALKKFKIPNAEKLSKREASALLDECIRRAKEHMPSFGQLQLLRKLGITFPPRDREHASQLIKERLGR